MLVRCIVSRLDGGFAYLVTPDHHVVEFPCSLLPEGMSSGNVLDFDINNNPVEAARRDEQLEDMIESALVEVQSDLSRQKD